MSDIRTQDGMIEIIPNITDTTSFLGPAPTFGPPQLGPTPTFGPTPSFGRPPFPGPPPFGPGIGNVQRFRRCLNRISLVTLTNRNQFWFYPTSIRRDRVIGFRWRRNRWEPSSIETFRILSMRCS